ncbi:hypothetical protein [Amylibacter sp. IMCC11727]|uniref:hypothetical protein n=1 Tax=Amylibacter sp. IMCC11727 TaxID=3039851 RepID=UPI00244DC704|nr:hypothetical protein [Amylibacter sp. IMCC11727]WGI22794.1 hypothetical protein QBD29_05080 [Amylibacter sp. IMCC11727]
MAKGSFWPNHSERGRFDQLGEIAFTLQEINVFATVENIRLNIDRIGPFMGVEPLANTPKGMVSLSPCYSTKERPDDFGLEKI